MGRPDGAHTHGHGGGGGSPVLLIVAAVVIMALGEPIAQAVAGAIQALVIMAAVVIGLVVVGGAAFVAWRLSRPPRPVTRVLPPTTAAVIPPDPRPAELHLHFHGVDPADVPAVVEAARVMPRPDRPGRVVPGVVESARVAPLPRPGARALPRGGGRYGR